MEKRVILTADDGMILTDGFNYGKVVYLAKGVDPSVYYQITEEEYNTIMENEHSDDEECLILLE